MKDYSRDILTERDEWDFFQNPSSPKMDGMDNVFAGGTSDIKLAV